MGYRIALVTSADMPKPDPETHLLAAELVSRGHFPEMVCWDDAVAWGDFEISVIRTTWDYYRRLPEFLSWAENAARMTRLLNPFETVRWNCHKNYLVGLGERGIPTIPTLLVEAGSADSKGYGSAETCRAGGEVVIKPAVSIGGFGALRTRAGSPEAETHLAGLLRTGDALVQPFMPSVLANGETSLIFFGGRFSHAVRKVPKPGEYRVQDHHGGMILPHDPDAGELEVAEMAMAAAPPCELYARVDLVEVEGRPAVIEMELIEPTLFLANCPGSAARFADAIEGVI